MYYILNTFHFNIFEEFHSLLPALKQCSELPVWIHAFGTRHNRATDGKPPSPLRLPSLHTTSPLSCLSLSHRSAATAPISTPAPALVRVPTHHQRFLFFVWSYLEGGRLV